MNNSPDSVKISIVIKALNEEAHIARAIESALAAIADFSGEVILADSLSTDRTVAIARRYPVRIVQLAQTADRCCGVGAQLGFQFVNGEYVYILDGDQALHRAFISEAIAMLDQQPDVAGVGGQVVEKNLSNHEFLARTKRALQHFKPGETRSLNTGGLYRKSALDDAGYFTNRNLHSYEEYELAARLRTKGYRLLRLATVSIDHYGHEVPEYQLLGKRWRSGYIMGLGEALKSAIGKPHLGLLLRELRELHIYGGLMLWWFALFMLLLTSVAQGRFPWLFLLLVPAPVLAMAWRKSSMRLGLFAVTAWHVNALGLLRGLCRSQRDPSLPVDANIIRDI